MTSQTWTVMGPVEREGPSDRARPTRDFRLAGVAAHAALRTRRGGLSDGVEELTVDNGGFTFRALPTRGMGIASATFGDQAIGWQSPIRGPVHPQFVNLADPSGLGWLDGFDELLVRCGLESNGAPDFDDQGRLLYPLHGRIANRPAQHVEVTIDGQAGEITVLGVVEETRFLFTKLRMTSTIKTRVGEKGFRIRDEVQNLSASRAQFQMLYHVNFGAPLLGVDARMVAPIKTLVPRNTRAAEGIAAWECYEAPQAGYEEQVYFCELLADQQGLTRTLLKNAHGTCGVSLIFNTRQLPCFTLWKNTTAVADGYVTGLEPGTNFPNPRSHEAQQGRVVALPPGGSHVMELQLEYHSEPSEVEAAEAAIGRLQGDHRQQVYRQPQVGWCVLDD